jgi:MoxR-like ATPase
MVRANKNKEAAVGSQNRTVSPNEAKSALTHCIKLQRPIMMWGAPGIGKSDIVKQIADAEGREVIDIRFHYGSPQTSKVSHTTTQQRTTWSGRVRRNCQLIPNQTP